MTKESQKMGREPAKLKPVKHLSLRQQKNENLSQVDQKNSSGYDMKTNLCTVFFFFLSAVNIMFRYVGTLKFDGGTPKFD